MQLTIVNGNNEKVGDLELNDELFGGRVKTRSDLAGGRAGERRRAARHTRDQDTAPRSAAAARSRGGRRAPGRARVGEIRNPLWRKGGTVFGPQPRSYAFDLPKKVRRGALRAALAQKVADGTMIVVDSLASEDRKTKGTAADAEAARRDRQDAADRREAGRRLRAERAQHRRRDAGRERPRDGARRRPTRRTSSPRARRSRSCRRVWDSSQLSAVSLSSRAGS